MTKAKTSRKTMGGGAVEPALFTHDGYRLHVFDGVPYMTDDDLADRLGFGRDRDIRKLIKRQEDNLRLLSDLGHGVPNPTPDLRHGVAVSSVGLLRRKSDRRPGTRGPIGTAYYLTQAQVRWIVIKSETPEADVLLRQLFSVFDAWEKGQLVSRAEAAEAALERPRATPQFSPFNQSRFAYGPPRAVPSNLVHAIAKDRVLKRFHTSLGITVTVIGDGLTILDHDLGFAIGGEMTLKARPVTRPLLPQLRKMGADPAHVIDVVGVRGRDEASTYFFLNYEQAKVVAESLDPHGHTTVQSQLDMIFYKAARGELATITIDAEGREAAAVIDAKVNKRGYRVPERYAHEPAAKTPASFDDRALPDPYVITMIGDIMEKIAMPLAMKVDELSDRVDSIGRALSAPKSDPGLLAEISALRNDIAPVLQSQIFQSPPQATNSRETGLMVRMRGAIDAFMNPKT